MVIWKHWVWALALGMAACQSGGGSHGHADEHEEGVRLGEAIVLSEAARRRASLELGEVVRRVMADGVSIPAEIALVPQRTAHVAPSTPGRLVEVFVEAGELIESGQVLAEVSSVEVTRLVSARESAQAELRVAQAGLTRQRSLSADGVSAKRTLMDAEAKVAQLKATLRGIRQQLELLGVGEGQTRIALKSPIDGVLVKAHGAQGEWTSGAEAPFIVSDPAIVWVSGFVPEGKVAQVRKGQRVRLRLSAFPEEFWDLSLDFVSPSLDRGSRSLPVRASLENPDGRFKAGLVGRLELLRGDGEEEARLAVPKEALVFVDGREAAFVPGAEDGAFELVFVKTGTREGAYVEVIEGLEEGQSLVVWGALTLKTVLEKDRLGGHDD